MSESSALRKTVPHSQSTVSGHTQMTSRQPYISEPIASKHVCFYKSGDAQFSGLPVVVNSRTFKTFEALLDSLSKRVPLPFGVRTITTPRGHTTVQSLDQLHHGQSYICSDRRTVKPVDLERARRKLPPWYHARPVSARRPAWQLLSPAPRGTRSARRNEHAALLHTPKRLVVFRNGQPELKHTLMLQKRTTHSFEALLEHISQVMNFPVLKIHTPDGRRVDGLPALILSSGVLVAAGREPFRKRNYDVQKTSPPTWLPAKRVGRMHPIERKKKSSIKSRPFSPSSERYFVEQIHNSIAGSMCDFPSNPAGSLDTEFGLPLESVVETDMITCVDSEGDMHVPSEDDIEKSFRVNQDGSMTVEMKVRLTIKEEETIHWTTTVSRSSVTSQVKAVSESSADLDAHVSEKLPILDDPASIEVREIQPEDGNHSPPEKDCEASKHAEINGGVASIEQEKHLSPTQTPELHMVQQTQASTESFRTVTDTEVQENSTYSYKEQRDNGEITEKYCEVHFSRPVPKPRGNPPSETNTTTRLQSSSYRASEVLQLQENGKEVRETVLHIYEMQTCQENHSGNTQLVFQGFGTSPDGSPHSRSASSETVSPATSAETFHSSSADMELETPATYEHQLTKHELHQTHKPTHKSNTTSTQRAKEPQRHFTPARASHNASVSRRISTPGTITKRKPVRVIVKKNFLLNTAKPERKLKDSKADILKEIRKIRADLISQTEAMKRKNHFRTKTVQKLLKRRNNTGGKNVSRREEMESSVSPKAEDPNLKESPTDSLSKKNLLQASLNKGPITHQTSIHESCSQGQTQENSQIVSLLHSPLSLKKEYVELWLQKSQPELTSHHDEELITTISPPKTTHENVSQPLSSAEVPTTVEDRIDGDGGLQGLVLDADTVMRTTASASCSLVNATTRTSYNERLPSKTTLGTSHEMTPLPRKLSLKESCSPLKSTVENNIPATANSFKQADIETSSPTNTLQDTPVTSQPSLETIPKNNTMAKASLFNNQSVEKTPLPTKELFDIKVPLKTPVNNDNTTKIRHNQQVSKLKMKISHGTDNNTSNHKKSHDIQTKPSSERTELQAKKFYTVKMAVRPDMKPVLDRLCCSLQSLREVTQTSRLKKSKSVPDFSSHLASAFGSSSRILLTFLSIMTLKDGLKHLHAHCQTESDLSYSEAMFMLQSLQELARIDDAEQLRQQLTDLHTSASVQLLQSWKGFQELSNKAKSPSITEDPTGRESYHSSSSEEEEEQNIQALMGDLGVPERVREELAAFSNIIAYTTCDQVDNIKNVSVSPPEVEMDRFSKHHLEGDRCGFSDTVLENYVNLYVSSVIDSAVNTHLEERSTSQISTAESPTTSDKGTVVMADRHHTGLSLNRNKTESHNSVSDLDTGEKPLNEYRFGMEMNRQMDLKRTEEIEEIKPMRQEIVKKRQENEVEMRAKTEIDEGTKTFSAANKSLEDLMRKEATHEEIDTGIAAEEECEVSETLVSCEGRLSSYEEKVNEGERENCDELVFFSEETSFNKEVTVQHSTLTNKAEEVRLKEKELLEHWQSQREFQTFQTQVQLHYEKGTDIGLPEEHQDVPHINHTEPNMEVDEIQHLNALQDFCVDSMTFSEEQHVIIEAPECYTIYQENFVEPPEEVNEYEEKETDFMEERTNSVAKLISSLEDQQRSVERRTYNSDQVPAEKILKHINVTSSETPKVTKTTDITSMDSLSSSLLFSYDTKNNAVTTDPEKNAQINRVKSIREMFLAKSSTDTQAGQPRLTSQTSDLSDYQFESSVSREHQSSPDVSKDDEDTGRLAIAKGYVRKTIERLYGKSVKGPASEEKRPAATHKAKKEKRGTNVTSLASMHEARTNAISDLSYFNATSLTDDFNDLKHLSLNTWVAPKDAVLIDKGRWLLRENQTSPKSSPEPKDKPKKVVEKDGVTDSEQDSGQEDVPYSLFGPTSPDKIPPLAELGEPTASTETTFTYFHLPNASDSEIETDKTDTTQNEPENTVTALPESNQCWTEKHGILTVFSLPDIKRTNKVQPLMETTPPVVTQPTKGQSFPKVQAEVAKLSTEPDALEILYMFCGQHCPIL